MISFFLAKVLSLYFIIMGIAMFTNAATFKSVIKDVVHNNNLLLLSGILALIVGILVVVSHNVWSADWRLIITIVGWISLIKGTVRVAAPELASKLISRVADNNNAYNIAAVIALIIGIFLGYHGFFYY